MGSIDKEKLLYQSKSLAKCIARYAMREFDGEDKDLSDLMSEVYGMIKRETKKEMKRIRERRGK